MSVFQNINGRSGEDIATEVVAHMLSSPRVRIPDESGHRFRTKPATPM